jgi:hypothetical protein
MLVTGGNYEVKIYHITYLSYPTSISIPNLVNATLPEIVHQDIVDEAVKVAIESNLYNKQLKS